MIQKRNELMLRRGLEMRSGLCRRLARRGSDLVRLVWVVDESTMFYVDLRPALVLNLY